jgi:hypothetical protein
VQVTVPRAQTVVPYFSLARAAWIPPIAVLEDPERFCSSALTPLAVLLLPRLLWHSAKAPLAVFSLPLVFE